MRPNRCVLITQGVALAFLLLSGANHNARAEEPLIALGRLRPNLMANDNRHRKVMSPEQLERAKQLVATCLPEQRCEDTLQYYLKEQRKAIEFNARVDAEIAAEERTAGNRKAILSENSHCTAAESEQTELSKNYDVGIARILRLLNAGANEKICAEAPAVEKAVNRLRADLTECADFLTSKGGRQMQQMGDSYLMRAGQINLIVKSLQDAQAQAGCR